VRETKAPLDPEAVVASYAEELRRYGIDEAQGDRYAAGFCAGAFERHGIRYTPSEKPKSALYLELLPLVSSQRVELLDHRTLLAQLERRTARGGRDSIDHGPGGHDDVANAATGAIVASLARAARWGFSDILSWYGPDPDKPSSEAERVARAVERLFGA